MLFTEGNFRIVDELRAVADELGRPMAQVALAWPVKRPGLLTALIGASRPEQLAQNIGPLDITCRQNKRHALMQWAPRQCSTPTSSSTCRESASSAAIRFIPRSE
ncbi:MULTISPECIES: aldo/keto reductase [unclassified Bradyrhizobium]